MKDYKIENVIAVFCLTGLSNCYNVIALNVPNFLEDAFKILENGDHILMGTRDGEMLDDDDNRFTFDYDLTCKLLSKHSTTKNIKKIKRILKDYEKLLNSDLQL